MTEGKNEAELNVYQRIAAVMSDVEYVQKDKQVSGGGGGSYKAVTHDQVVAHVRDAMVKHGIVIEPHQLAGDVLVQRNPDAGAKMMLYAGRYAVHFVNIDNPDERAIAEVEAHAQDNGDKAPGKALTYATKAAILKMFSLETGEDDESRLEAEKPLTATQVKMLDELLDKVPGDDSHDAFCTFYEIETIADLPRSSFDRAIASVRKKVQA